MRKGVIVPETSMSDDVGSIADEFNAWFFNKQSGFFNTNVDMQMGTSDAASSISMCRHWILPPALDEMALIAEDDGNNQLGLSSVSIGNDSPPQATHRGTAVQHGLSPEQYLYVLASFCDVSVQLWRYDLLFSTTIHCPLPLELCNRV